MGDPVHASHEHTGASIMLRHDQVHAEVTIGTKVFLEAPSDFARIKVERTNIYLTNHTTIITNSLGDLPFTRTFTLEPLYVQQSNALLTTLHSLKVSH